MSQGQRKTYAAQLMGICRWTGEHSSNKMDHQVEWASNYKLLLRKATTSWLHPHLPCNPIIFKTLLKVRTLPFRAKYKQMQIDSRNCLHHSTETTLRVPTGHEADHLKRETVGAGIRDKVLPKIQTGLSSQVTGPLMTLRPIEMQTVRPKVGA